MKTMLPALALFLFPVQALAFSVGWPVACEYGKDCFIQNYVDEDSTTSARDFTCGSLTYDGHKGTDIRLRNLYSLSRGVAVLAAADGTVRATRDGMDDISVATIGREAVKQRECGNGVVIHHGTGYETQYCHLMKGSIAVTQGQAVKAGQVLGRIGLSGATEFPHVHFQIQRLGRIIDPFTAEIAGGSCGKSKASLWQHTPAYIPTALLDQGFTASPPKLEQVSLLAPVAQVPRMAPALVYWVNIMGARQGDILTLTVLTPNGQVAVTRETPITRNLAQSFNFVGKKATAEGLVPGTYKASYKLVRKNEQAPVIEGGSEIEVPF